MSVALQVLPPTASKPWMGSLFGVYAIITGVSLQGYFNWQSPVFLLGIIVLFSASAIQKQYKGSKRYAYAAVILCMLNLLMPVKTILYASIACAVLFTIEHLYGRMGLLPLIIIGLMSPFCQFLCDVFTFPVRLRLSAWAVQALQFAGVQASTEGNIIVHNGNEFSVDPACMGLNMMITSLLMGIALIVMYQKQFQKRISPWLTLGMLTGITALNIVSNLLRIVFLVQFSIMPEAWMHEVTGIICFVVYVIFPGAALCKWMIKRFGNTYHEPGTSPAQADHKPEPLLHFTVLFFILLSSFAMLKYKSNNSRADKHAPAVDGYSVQRVDAQITKLENAVSLVYIKNIPGFYAADHTPFICWKGSGYSFRKIRERTLHGVTVYGGLLQKDHEQLYTIWWYDNGEHRTISQLDWRWHMLKGENNYSIINVTSAHEKQAMQEAEEILATHRFKHLLQ